MTDARPADELPGPPAGPGFTMLAGIRVLDITTSYAGPYASLLLADMGAEVIKLERPGTGDDCRHWGPPFLDDESLWFLSVNRNKKSIEVDYRRDAGRKVLLGLAAKADIVINNQLPKVRVKLGSDYESLKAAKEDLIYVSLTGFGAGNFRQDWPSYDLIAEGYSGIMDMTGEIESGAQKVGTPAADLLAGMDAAMASASALQARARTGKGCLIDIALVDSMSRFLMPWMASYLGSGTLHRRSGGRESVISIYQTFETADDPLTLGLGNDGLFRRFWNAVGQPEVADEPTYATNSNRRAVRPELVERIQDVLKTRPRAKWLELFAEEGVPAGPINRLDEVARDPVMLERGMFYQMKRGGRTPVPQINTGILVDGAANAPSTPPPALGEHTRSVLSDLLDYGDDDFKTLEAEGVIPASEGEQP